MRKDRKNGLENSANQSIDVSPQAQIEEATSTKSPAEKKVKLSDEVASPKSPAFFEPQLPRPKIPVVSRSPCLTEEQKALWVWDGNVPTNYKTKCGKALGRWINNQRTSKTKGTLKDDREVRLVSTGLKWSVLTTNSWNEMLRELKLYAQEKRQGGRRWDGNVPTNHKIVVERSINGRKTEDRKRTWAAG
ncbi:hypothetical protein ACHAXN_011057 [Cyclotella atomus]